MNSEKELITKILSGEPDDFRVLIQKYKKLVSHIIFRVVSNPTDREELGQEIFIKVYENLATFQFKSKFSTWIGRIAYNAALNYARKKRIPLYEDFGAGDRHEDFGQSNSFRMSEIESLPQQPDEEFIKLQVSSLLHQHIESLPVQYRIVLTCFHVDNLSYREISEITALPEGTVKSYIFRGRKILKDRLLAEYTMEELCL
ncbi:MAG: RNA polymerase sigma factor [Candidatus Zhuqueibacterota bacterium]